MKLANGDDFWHRCVCVYGCVCVCVHQCVCEMIWALCWGLINGNVKNVWFVVWIRLFRVSVDSPEIVMVFSKWLANRQLILMRAVCVA